MSKNADEPDRRVVFTRPAQDDLLYLKQVHRFDRSCWLSLRANLERLAGCRNPGDEPNVELLRMCSEMGGEWLRWKHPGIPCPSGIRVAFQVTDDELAVWAVLMRDDSTYKEVERRLRKWLASVL